jgi:Flp pilus assembly protein TadG
MRRGLDLKDNAGTTALEFALISPALLLLVIGGFQLAWALHTAATVRWSLESSARGLMLDPSETADTLKTNMLARLGGRASASDLAVTIAPDTSNPAGKLLVATSVFHTTLSMPFITLPQLTFTAVTKVPAV